MQKRQSEKARADMPCTIQHTQAASLVECAIDTNRYHSLITVATQEKKKRKKNLSALYVSSGAAAFTFNYFVSLAFCAKLRGRGVK